MMGLMPQELVSAGLTLPRLFSKYLGDPVSTSTNECIDLYNLMSHPTPSSICTLFTEFGFYDIPTEAHHHSNFYSSELASALLCGNVYGRTTNLHCEFISPQVDWQTILLYSIHAFYDVDSHPVLLVCNYCCCMGDLCSLLPQWGWTSVLLVQNEMDETPSLHSTC